LRDVQQMTILSATTEKEKKRTFPALGLVPSFFVFLLGGLELRLSFDPNMNFLRPLRPCGRALLRSYKVVLVLLSEFRKSGKKSYIDVVFDPTQLWMMIVLACIANLPFGLRLHLGLEIVAQELTSKVQHLFLAAEILLKILADFWQNDLLERNG